MKRAPYKFILALLLAAIISFAKIEAASAQLSISVFPLSVKGQANPGEIVQGSVTILNASDIEAVRIRPEKENLMGGAEGVVELLGERDTGWGISSWIKFEAADEFILAPKEKKIVNYTITIPDNAQPGGHFGAVLFRALPIDKQNDNQSGVSLSGRVGTVLLYEVSGDVNKSAEISEVSVNKFISHGPIDLQFKIKNNGNSYFTPTGTITYQNLWRKEAVEFSNPGKKDTDLNQPGVVFPGYNRTYISKWDIKYLIGPIKITFETSMQEDGTVIPSKTVYIWAFPWQEFSILVALILILFIGFVQFKKKFKIVRA
jgi:hypothetical protein